MGKITKEKFETYVRVQGWGTDMFDIKTVILLSGLTKSECIDIMAYYPKYKEKYASE